MKINFITNCYFSLLKGFDKIFIYMPLNFCRSLYESMAAQTKTKVETIVPI